MKHVAPETFHDCPSAPTGGAPSPAWRERLAAWWRRIGWNAKTLPPSLRADVEADHPGARPIRGRAEWERRL